MLLADNVNPTENKYGAHCSTELIYVNNGCAQYNKGGSLQLISSLFGGAADQYLLMPAINSLRIIMSCESVNGSFFRMDKTPQLIVMVSILVMTSL